MSDLSQLLDGLYADETPPRAPAWSSEEALDEAFSSWVPGPPADAPSAERSILSEAIESYSAEPAEPDAGVADWLMDTEPLAPEASALVEEDAEVAEVAGAPMTHWVASDDDILPGRGPRKGGHTTTKVKSARRFSFSLKR